MDRAELSHDETPNALERLLVDEAFSQVVVLTRRLLQREHPKLLEQRIDFERLKDYRSLMVADTAAPARSPR